MFLNIKERYSIVIILYTTLICSCTSKSPHHVNYSKRLIADTSITIPVDNTTPNYSNYIQVYNVENKEYLVLGNHEKRSIQFYDLQTTELVKEINLHKDGPNGIGGLYGFLVKSLDSIYVLNGYFYKVYLVNGEGQILKTYSLLNQVKQNQINNPANL